MQFALDVIAQLRQRGHMRIRELNTLAQRNGLAYSDQVIRPLCNAEIMRIDQNVCRTGENFNPFALPLGTVERDYLQWILRSPEATLFLREDTIRKLASVDGSADHYAAIDFMEPKGAQLPGNPGPEGFRTLLRAIRENRMIHYEFRTKDEDVWSNARSLPWRLEYSAYDRRWWLIVYLPEEDRTVKARLDNIRNVQMEERSEISGKTVLAAVDRLLAPKPMVLEVERRRGAMERCFMAFENQLFVETKQLSDDRFRLAFRYYRFDETELLRRLLLLGPMVTLIGPKSAKEKLKELIDQALAL